MQDGTSNRRTPTSGRCSDTPGVQSKTSTTLTEDALLGLYPESFGHGHRKAPGRPTSDAVVESLSALLFHTKPENENDEQSQKLPLPNKNNTLCMYVFTYTTTLKFLLILIIGT